MREMANLDPWATLAAELATLRVHDADPERAERIRERCLARLAARRRSRAPRARARLLRSYSRLEPALAFGLGAFYLAAVVRQALALLR